jgi:hypothetical protein
MLDLKAKLLAAGVIDEDAVDRVEQEQKTKRDRNKRRKLAQSERGRWNKRVEALVTAPKAEQYETTRGWVQRTRLNPDKGLPSEKADRFHFETADQKISWLTLEPDVKEELVAGDAGIVAYMSHNGLKHCVVPRDVAIDIGRVRPEWLRHLERYERPAPVVDAAAVVDAAPAVDDALVADTEPAEPPAVDEPAIADDASASSDSEP